MRIGRNTNGISCEYVMQDVMEDWIKAKELIYKREARVKEVKRIADFLLLKGAKLINIEAKCNNFSSMLKQLNDHATYCDYCFAYIPDYSHTPEWFKNILAKKGYGLIIYNFDKNIVTEVLEAHHNAPKNKELKKWVIKSMKILNREKQCK